MIELSIEPSSNNIPTLSEEYHNILMDLCQQILIEFECSERSVSILVCDNQFIQKLNKDFRQKDCPTDVLSFAFDDDEEFELPNSSLGEIIISAEKAIEQAKEFEVSYEEEFSRLCIHGLLHLLGYDHELGEEEHKEMFKIQDEYMNTFMQRYNGTQSHLI